MANATYNRSDVVFHPKGTNWRFEDLEGQEFGRLKVIGYAGKVGRITTWWCECECGNISKPHSHSLKSGKTSSCGCKVDEELSSRARHGLTKTKVHRAWAGMKNRCTNPKEKKWKNHGGRGITFCERWNYFDNFFDDMGHPPSKQHSLDRIDNDGHYSCGKCPECLEKKRPANCRWADWKTQQNNRRSNRLIKINGETKSLAEWCREYNINSTVVQRRAYRGMSWVEAITTPLLVKRRKYTFEGQEKNLNAWCRHFKVPYSTACQRLEKGMAFEQAMGISEN